MNNAGSRRRNALRRTVGVAVAIALAATACGSSDVETEVATSPPAKEA
jgi:hypothetical protein